MFCYSATLLDVTLPSASFVVSQMFFASYVEHACVPVLIVIPIALRGFP
jgi:hypothetical protein